MMGKLVAILVALATTVGAAQFPTALYSHQEPTGPYPKSALTDVGREIEAIEAFVGISGANLLLTGSLAHSSNLAGLIDDETGTGAVVFNSSPLLITPTLNPYTIGGTLPAAGTTGRLAVVTNAANGTTCTSGGGSSVVLCRDTGSVWAPLGDGTSAGSGGHTIAQNTTTFTARSVLSFLAGPFVVADDVGNGRTTVSLTTSPSNATTVVGTARTITVPTPLVSSAGTLASDISLTWQSQAQKLFFAGPTSGGNATPSFRAFAATDVPNNALDFAQLADSLTLDATTTINIPTTRKLQFIADGTGYFEFRKTSSPFTQTFLWTSGGNTLGSASLEMVDSGYGGSLEFSAHGPGADDWPTKKYNTFAVYQDGTVRVKPASGALPATLLFTSTANGLGAAALEAIDSGAGSDFNLSVHNVNTNNWPTGKVQPLTLSHDGSVRVRGTGSTTATQAPQLWLDTLESVAQNNQVCGGRGCLGDASLTPGRAVDWIIDNWGESIGLRTGRSESGIVMNHYEPLLKLAWDSDWLGHDIGQNNGLGLRVNLRVQGYPENFFGTMLSLAAGDGEPGKLALYHADNDAWPTLAYWGYSANKRNPAWGGIPVFGLAPQVGYLRQPNMLVSSQGQAGAIASFRESLPGYGETVYNPNIHNPFEMPAVAAAEECTTSTRNQCTQFQGWNAGLTCNPAQSTSWKPWDGTNGGCGQYTPTCTSRPNEGCGPGIAGTCSGGFCTNTPSRSCSVDADCEAGFLLGRRFFVSYAFEDFDTGDGRDPTALVNDAYGQANCPECIMRGQTMRSREAAMDVPSSAGNGRGYKFLVTLPKMCYGNRLFEQPTGNGSGICSGTGATCTTDSQCSAATADEPAGAASFCMFSTLKKCSTDADCGAVQNACRWAPADADRVQWYVPYTSNNPADGTKTITPTYIHYRLMQHQTKCSADSQCGGGTGSCATLGDGVTKECKSTYILSPGGFYENDQATYMNELTDDVVSIYSGLWSPYTGNRTNPAVSIRVGPAHKNAFQVLYGQKHRGGARCSCATHADCAASGNGGFCDGGFCTKGDSTRTACSLDSQCAAAKVCTLQSNYALGTELDSSGSFWTKGMVKAGTGGGNIPSCQAYRVTKADLTTAGTSQTVTLFQLPARGKVLGLTLKHAEAFTGGGLTAMTVSVGSAAGSTTYYCSAFNVFQAVSNTAFQDCVTGYKGPSTMAADNVTATFTSTSANVNVATTGAVDVDVCWMMLP